MDPDSAKHKEVKHEPTFGEIFKHLFFKRFKINLLIILILLAFSVWGAIAVKDTFFPSFAECPICEECPEINQTTCPECPECEEIECPKIKCPECNCTEEITAFLYRCEDGRIVNKSDECDEVLMEITSEHFSADNGITLSIDDIDYDYLNEEGRINEISYTIINKGDHAILPKVGVKVYEEWTQEIKDMMPMRTFKEDDILVKNDGIRHSKSVLIDFEGKEQTMRLELVDTIPDPDETIVTVLWKFIE